MTVSIRRSDLLKGARFGSYEVVRLLGHGATASVFEARHVALGRPAALKILHEHLAEDAEVSARFVREGRVAAQLRHPNVVDVLDVGVEAGVPYLVMDRLDGRDLHAHLKEKGRLPLVEALALLVPIASAVAHAHALGAVHRDLKPANVFLARVHGGQIVPKVVDFGLSKIAADTDGPPLTATNTVVGTVHYMAPEQTLGSRHTSPKSDQYALGVILYECVVGAPPFTSDGFYGLLEAIRTQPIRPPSIADARLPEDLDRVVLRALGRDPEKRYPSVHAFAEALLAFADEATRAAWNADQDRPADASSPALPVRAADEELAPARELETVLAADPPRTRTPKAERAPEEPAPFVAPPLPCAPGASPFHIKGIAYRGFFQLAARRIPGGVEAILAAITDARIASFMRQPFLAASRYDILPFLPLNAASAALLGVTLEALARDAGIGQASYDARTVYKRMVEARTLEDLETRIPRFGMQYYDFGSYDARLLGPRKLVMRRKGIPAYVAPWYAPMQAAYVEEIVRQLGATWAEARPAAPLPAGGRGAFPIVDIDTEIVWRE